MTQSFKAGQRVRLVEDYGTCLKGDLFTVTSVDDKFTDARRDGDSRAVGAYHRRFELVKPEPKFKVGDRVRLVESIDGMPVGTIGTVESSKPTLKEDENFVYRVGLPGGFDLGWYERRLELAPSQVFKLNTGDTIRNNHTGRVGYVVWGSPFHEGHNGPTRRWVVDESHGEETGATARAVEAYEAEYPGTYEVVSKGGPF